MSKNTRVMDIIIFGICMFTVLLMVEYRNEVSANMLWGVSIPMAIIGIFFGFRAANPDIVRGDREE